MNDELLYIYDDVTEHFNLDFSQLNVLLFINLFLWIISKMLNMTSERP